MSLLHVETSTPTFKRQRLGVERSQGQIMGDTNDAHIPTRRKKGFKKLAEDEIS
jgi:hypothetical protein